MTRKGLWLLAAFALLAIVAAIVALQRTEVSQEETTALMFPELAAKANAIARIEITGAEKTVVIERQDKSWTLAAKDHYPADGDRVGQLVAALAHLTLLEEKTSDAARYPDLNLGPPGKDMGAGEEVKLLDVTGTAIADVIIGRNAANLGRIGGGVYVRRTDQPKSWLAQGTIEVPTNAIEWTDHNLFDLSDPGGIKSATIAADGKPVVTIGRAKPDDQIFTISPTPPGQTDQGKALRLATLPVSLSFDDIRASHGDDAAPARTAHFQGFAAGTGYTLDVFPSGKDVWVRASEDGESAVAKAYNEFHAKWLYKLPQYRGALLTATIKDFSVTEEPAAKPVRNPK